MSLREFFMADAIREHQNMLNSDNAGIILQSLAQGVASGIEQQQAAVQKQRDDDKDFNRKLTLVRERYSSGQKIPVSLVDTKTGEIKEVGSIPHGSKIYQKEKEKTSSEELEALSPGMQTQAWNLARKYGTGRNMEKVVPSIAKSLAQGKTIDEIDDEMRMGSQSAQFANEFRGATQSILIGEPNSISDKAMDYIDDELSSGNIDGAKFAIKKLARDKAGADVSKSILGKERTVEFINEIQGDLDLLEKNGINTDIFSGTFENMNKKIGYVNNPELRKVATKIALAIQNYRRSMSGAAFSIPESEEYKAVFPSISSTAGLNRAQIDAIRETFQGDLDNFYSLSMGKNNYDKLFGRKLSFDTPEQADAAGLPNGTIVDVGGRRYEIDG
jgi:hypothetical protein